MSTSTGIITPHVRHKHERVVHGKRVEIPTIIVNRRFSQRDWESVLAVHTRFKMDDTTPRASPKATLATRCQAIVDAGVRDYARLTPAEAANLATARLKAHLESRFSNNSTHLARQALAQEEYEATLLSISRLAPTEQRLVRRLAHLPESPAQLALPLT